MRIALLYSGQLRTLAETIESNIAYFKQFDDDVQIDLFFSLSTKMGYVNTLNDERHVYGSRRMKDEYAGLGMLDLIIDRVLCKKLKKAVLKKCAAIENTPLMNFEIQHSCPHPLMVDSDKKNLIYQYYKIWNCYKMMKNPEEYDLIVRMRCDVILQSPPPAVILQDCLELGRLMVNNFVWANHKSETMVNEMFFMGSPAVMAKACNIFNNFKAINGLIENKVCQAFGESIFYGSLLTDNLAPDRLYKFDFDYKVIR